MKKLLLTLQTIIVFCAYMSTSWAQTNPGAGLRPGWYTLGIHGGLSYQQSDVPVRLRGGGLGITLAKNLIHSPSGGFDFDLRGRLGYSHSFGLDTERNFDLADNPAVNGSDYWDYTQYEDGFIYNNHKTQMAELGLEGVLTFGSLREKTGVVLSGYGGIGLDWFRTFANQGSLGTNSDYFDAYRNIDQSSSTAAIRRTLRNDILDGQHESLAQGFENNEYGRLRFMPYWGVELGYDLSKRWGIGLGHKVTYSGINDLDGYRVSGTPNDIHHLTYAQIWYRFNGDKEEEPPIINIIDPGFTPYVTRDPYKLMLAEVINVKKASQVYVTHNGLVIPFDFRKGDMKMDLLLKDGINTIIITAENTAGKAQAEQIIILEEPETDDPPMIRYLVPEAPGLVVGEVKFDLRAEILYIENPRDIRLLINGRVASNFRFDEANAILSHNFTLQEGVNNIEIEAKNRRGSATETTTVIYEIPILPPTIRLVTPSSSPYRTQAVVQNVTMDITQIIPSKGDELSVVYNGFQSNRFEYNERTGRWTAQLNLEIGQNFLSVYVANPMGEARADLVVIREQVLPPPPMIRIVSQNIAPASGSNPLCAVDVVATVSGVQYKQDIQVRIGNTNFSNFSFNVATGQVRLQTSIPKGGTSMTITASNPGGTVTETLALQCIVTEAPLKKPVVKIEQPVNNSTVDKSAQNIVATIREVTNRNDINVLLNGSPLRAFNFNPDNQTLTALVNLRNGSNQIEVNASNKAGKASDQIMVTYRLATPPTVSIQKPANNTTTGSANTSFEALVANITAKGQVALMVNNTSITNFTLSGNKVAANLELSLGLNTIRIKVQNTDGQAEATTRITYQVPKPIIIGRVPSKDTTITTTRLNLSAEIKNVMNMKDILLTVNGRRMMNPTFNNKTGILSQRLSLNEGQNRIFIQATNAGGTATKEMIVQVVTRELTPPVVTVVSASQPAFDPFNPETGQSTIIVDIKHVTNREDIIFLHNGKVDNSFTFSPKTGRLEHTVTLLRGQNQFEIKASNKDGTDTGTATVAY